MTFVFRGHLCGTLCSTLEITEDLTDGIVRLYRPAHNGAMERVVAPPKQTTAIVNAKQVSEKTERLLAEGTIDAQGNFRILLDENEMQYDGMAFEVDIYLEQAPNQKQNGDKPTPVQVQITTLQPRWRQREEGLVSVFDFCFSERTWCAIRQRLGAWVIVGRLTACPTEQNPQSLPLPNHTVHAFDNDWISDDPLGSGTTNSNGIFRIDYQEIDFKQTFLSPWLNVETLDGPGPDVYLHVDDFNGNSIYREEPARGLEPDRDNSPACLCIDLCVPSHTETFPYFNRYGEINLSTDIRADGKVSRDVPVPSSPGSFHGRTDYAFYDNVVLKGFVPKAHPVSGKPMRYRFLYAEDPGGATPAIPHTPLTGDLIRPTRVAEREYTRDNGFGISVRVYQNVIVHPDMSVASPPGPLSPVPPAPQPLPNHNMVPSDAPGTADDGWIEVDQLATDDYNGPLLTFNTQQVVPASGLPAVSAGDPITAPANGRLLQIRMQVSATDGTGLTESPIYPMYVNNYPEIGELDLAVGGTSADKCAELSGDIDIQYTIDHELLATWQLNITTLSTFDVSLLSLPSASNPPAGATVRGASGTRTVATATWPTCVYTFSLSGRRMLTDGIELDDSDLLDRRIPVYIKN